MQHNRANTHVFSSVVILMLVFNLWLTKCTPGDDVVVATARPTVEARNTAAFPTITIAPKPIPTAVPYSVLPIPVPPLPGMLYWGPDEQGTWLVEANGQPVKISEFQVLPHFLPDGSAFVYFKDGKHWKANRDGSDLTALASPEGYDSEWANFSVLENVLWFIDAGEASIDKGELGKLKLVDIDGQVLTLSEGYLLDYPMLSPDGKSIAYKDGGRPVIYHLDRGKQLLDISDYSYPAELEFVEPFWSPDQTKLAWTAYDSYLRGVAANKLVIFDLQAGASEMIQVDGGIRNIHRVDWQPDGDKVLIIHSKRLFDTIMYEYDSWIFDLKTKEVIPIGSQYFAQWSPDGKWLAYTEEVENDWMSLWVMSVDDRERHHIGAGYEGTWSPDSRFLLYCGPGEKGLEGEGSWLTSSESDWMALPVNFGFPVRCDTFQWVTEGESVLTAYVLPDVQPTLTPTVTPIPPTPSPTSAAIAACNLDIINQGIYPSESLQGKILFASENQTPFLKMGVLSSLSIGRGVRGSQLWAVAPGGKQANRLTDEHYGIAWYRDEATSLPVSLMSNTELIIDEELIQQVPLPPECDIPPQGDTSQRYTCGRFQISPDGKWAAFSAGDYLSGYNVRPGLINLETLEVQFPTMGTGTNRFLPDNQRFVANSWGEGGEIYWANSLTGESLRLGSAGNMLWNADETAVATEATSYHGFDGVVWGYNIETGNLFLPEPQNRGVDRQPIWTQDGTHLLYQHHIITVTGTLTFTYGPGEIQLVDAISGEKRVLAADPEYHYQLCETYEMKSCRWAEDWIQIRRYPYQPDPFNFEDYQDSGFRCAWYGADCLAPIDYLGLNWRTGEMVLWRDVVQLASRVTPAPTAVPSGPNLLAAPLHADSEIGYALYMGHDGRSLYCVPEGGLPQKWVQDAEWFLYVP